MLIFDSPWWFLALLLPFVMLRVPAYRTTRAAIRIPWFQRLAKLANVTPRPGAVVAQRSKRRWMVDIICYVLIVTAMARPQWLEPPITQTVSVRDLLLLVDLSGSMDTEDFTNKGGEKVNRLEAVKEVLDDFLLQRKDDRVGLVVFGTAAYVQVPFTHDVDTARLLLEELQPRMAGPKTAFGDAIGLGITLFEKSEAKQRVMIALTDGNDTGSKIPPSEAASIAGDHEITIHTVAVGNAEAVGEEKLDVAAMEAVCAKTGGRFFSANDREQLAGIYEELDRIETHDADTVSYRPRKELFIWPIALMLFLSAGSMVRKAVKG